MICACSSRVQLLVSLLDVDPVMEEGAPGVTEAALLLAELARMEVHVQGFNVQEDAIRRFGECVGRVVS